jgi:hypothetical protein
MKTKEEIVKRLQDGIDHHKRELAEFADAIKDNAAHALEFGDQAFEYAAELKVYLVVLGALTDPHSKATLETVAEYALDKVMRGAKNTSQSTSACLNIMKAEETAAWANMFDSFNGPLRGIL